MKSRERCDHCKKFVEGHNLSTLEETVSQGIDFNFAICQKCFARHTDSKYWEKWINLVAKDG